MVWEIDRVMREYLLNPFELSEFDADIVNPATRKDLERLSREGNVFGFKIWGFEFIPAEKLKDVGAFEVDVVIREEKRAEVERLIEDYKKGRIDDWEYVNRVTNLAYYVCLWV